MGCYDVGGLTVEVVEGDITGADTDAFVHAANDRACVLFGRAAVALGTWNA